MTEYSEERSYEDGAEPAENAAPDSRGTAGKQLLIIIQLIICGAAVLFMLVMKLIGGDFCGGITAWYKESYNASISISGGGNDLSIFDIAESSSESSSDA